MSPSGSFPSSRSVVAVVDECAEVTVVEKDRSSHQHQQQPHQNHHTRKATAVVGGGDHDSVAWDVLPPLWSFPPPQSTATTTTTTPTTTTSAASTARTTTSDYYYGYGYGGGGGGETESLQYPMTLQHLGTCLIPNDTFASSVTVSSSAPLATTTTNATTEGPSPVLSPPTISTTTTSSSTTCSTHPILMTIASSPSNRSSSPSSSSSSYYMIVGYHDGTIAVWNLQQIPALRQQYRMKHDDATHDPTLSTSSSSSSSTMSNRPTNPDGTTPMTTPEPPTLSSTSRPTGTTTSIDPIQALDTWSPVPPCCTLDTTQYFGPAGTTTTTTTTATTTTTSLLLSTIVHISPVFKSQRKFVAMNIVGMIFVVQITRSHSDDGTTTTTTTTERMEIPQMWSTGRIHPTAGGCLTGDANDGGDDDDDDGNDDTNLRIVIGYSSGHLECWAVSSLSSSSVESPTHHDDEAGAMVEPTKQMPTLQWRGHFTNDHSSPPPSIVGMVPLLVPSSSKHHHHHHPIIPFSEPHECIVVTLQNDGHQRPNTSATVEVIDITSIMKVWNEQQLPAPSELLNDNNVNRSLPLDDFIVLPEAGREIVNVGAPHSSSTSFQNWIPSRGTNAVVATTVTSPHRSEDDSNVIAVGHADGMITILDVSSIDQTSATPAWGVSSSHRRYCSLYPCVGLGRMDLYDPTNTPQPYLVGCLRGGATYLIPLHSSSSRNDGPVLAVTVPHDAEDDGSIRYTQGFAAGNIPVHQRYCDETTPPTSSGSIPLLVYVWPGGVIDVYSCGLLPHTSVPTDVPLLQELIANGSVDALRAWILSSHHDNDRILNPNWTNALHEIRRHGETSPITINDIISDTFASLRTELLNLNQ